MKVYTTRYALTTGIEVHEVRPSNEDNSKYVYTLDRYVQQFILGKDAFLTYEDAAVAAREMRDKRVASLMKQLTKVRSLLFPTKMPERLRTPAKED